MKQTVLLLSVLMMSVQAFAGSLVCTGEGVSLSEEHSDGGAFMEPTIQLVVNGDVKVDMGMGRPGVRDAVYGLAGKAKKLSKTVRTGDYEVSYFRQQMNVNGTSRPNPQIFFIGEVVCRQSVYVGMPRP